MLSNQSIKYNVNSSFLINPNNERNLNIDNPCKDIFNQFRAHKDLIKPTLIEQTDNTNKIYFKNVFNLLEKYLLRHPKLESFINILKDPSNFFVIITQKSIKEDECNIAKLIENKNENQNPEANLKQTIFTIKVFIYLINEEILKIKPDLRNEKNFPLFSFDHLDIDPKMCEIHFIFSMLNFFPGLSLTNDFIKNICLKSEPINKLFKDGNNVYKNKGKLTENDRKIIDFFGNVSLSLLIYYSSHLLYPVEEN